MGARLGPERYHELRYEELVADPERILRELCAFVELPYDERMLRYHEQADRLVPSLSHSEHHGNLYKPPTAGLRDWRRDLSPQDVAVFEALAGDLLDELGYERRTARPGFAASLAATRFRVGTEVLKAVHGTRVRGRKMRKRVVKRATGRGSELAGAPVRSPAAVTPDHPSSGRR